MPVPTDLTAPAMPGAVPVDQQPEHARRLSARPNHRFFLVCYPDHPGNWFVGEIHPGEGVEPEEVGLWWLPVLQREPVVPGLNLNRTLKKGEPAANAYDNAHAHIRRDGGIILPSSLNYCVGVDCTDPRTQEDGTLYIDAWSTPRPARRGKRTKFNFDRQRYHRFLLRLMVDGVIPQPAEDLLDELRRKYRSRIGRREAQAELPEKKREELIAEATANAERVESAEVPRPEEVAPKKLARRSPKKEG